MNTLKAFVLVLVGWAVMAAQTAPAAERALAMKNWIECDWPRTLNELDRYRRPRRQPGRIDVTKDAGSTGDGYDDGRVRRFLDAVWSKEKLNDAP